MSDDPTVFLLPELAEGVSVHYEGEPPDAVTIQRDIIEAAVEKALERRDHDDDPGATGTAST